MRLTNLHPKVVRWASRVVSRTRYRATKRGVPFNITSQFLLSMWTGLCPCLGVILTLTGKQTRTAPSLDCKIPSLGYTKGNVVILSMRANAIKSDATAPEVNKVARWLEKQWRQ